MRLIERGLKVKEKILIKSIEIRKGDVGVNVVDKSKIIKIEEWKVEEEKKFCKLVDEEYVGERIRMGLDKFRKEKKVMMEEEEINIVMIKKSSWRKKKIRNNGGVGNELIVKRKKEIIKRK